MDKAERVAAEIAERMRVQIHWQGNKSKHPDDLKWLKSVVAMDAPDIAAILRREYGDVRREALEEAARIADAFENSPGIGPNMGCISRQVAAAIRAAKEES